MKTINRSVLLLCLFFSGFCVHAADSISPFAGIASKPAIAVKIDGTTPLAGDPISTTPKVEITVTTVNGLTLGRLKVGSTAVNLTFVNVGNNYYATSEISTPLSVGRYAVTIEAFDGLNQASTTEMYPMYVQTDQDLAIQGVPLCYPNPFDPAITGTTISYLLSKSADINLSIYALSGTAIYKRSFASGSSGGHAGYNTVAWDGKSDSGDYAGNGIYVILLAGEGKIISKGKITVIKR